MYKEIANSNAKMFGLGTKGFAFHAKLIRVFLVVMAVAQLAKRTLSQIHPPPSLDQHIALSKMKPYVKRPKEMSQVVTDYLIGNIM